LKQQPAHHLGSASIAGSVLTTPRPTWSFHIVSERDHQTLVLHIAELPDPAPLEGDPAEIAQLRVTRGSLPRTLDVLREFIDVLGAWPDMRARLNNLEPMLADESEHRG
jgi:hypothetical protein